MAPQSSPPRVPHASGELSSAQVLERFAFGSCNRQGLPQPLWDPILDTHPDLWMWLGDNIYADTEDMEVMRQKYAQQLANVGYRRLRDSVPVIGIWDDHD